MRTLSRVLLCLLVWACDDGSSDPADLGPTADGASPDAADAADPGDGALDSGTDGAVPDGGPMGADFVITAPGMDEVLAGTAEVVVETEAEVIAGIAVRIGEQALGRDEFAGDRLAVTLDPAALPDGDQTLSVDALDDAGVVLGTRTVTVRIVADPPGVAMIDEDGGALRSPNGVIVIVPPGAVENPTGFRVRDRTIDSLPDVVGDRPLEILQAIDLLPMEGPADPTFRFNRPARILFPVEDTDNAQQAGSPPFVGNIGGGAGGPELRFVSSVRVGGGWAATGGGGATVSSVHNLSRPGEPLQSLDLLELRGTGFPPKPFELRVRLDGRAPIDVTVGPGGRTARFVIPPDVAGDPVAIELVNRRDARRQIVQVPIAPRQEPLPEVAVADARIATLFDGIDGQLEMFETGTYADMDAPQAGEIGAMRDQLQTSLGMPLASWRGVLAEARADMMALSDAERQQIGAALAGLEESLAGITQAGPLLITQDEGCLSLLIMSGMLQYLDFVTGIIPNWTPPGLLKSALLKTAIAMVDFTAKSVGCDEDDEDDGGIWGYECDLLIVAEEAEMTAGVTGDVIGYGPRSPGGMGLTIGGQSIFDFFANAMFMMEGVRIRLVDPGTGDSAALFTDLTNPDGTFTIPFVTPDSTVDAVLTLPDGTEITIPIPTPGDGEFNYIPIFVPVPDFEQPPAPDDFPFVARTGAAAGLLDDTNSGVPAVADFDDDGLLDVYFPGQFDGIGREFLIRYLARNVGGGQFQSLEYGPFPDAAADGLNQLHSVTVDVDGDGDLDLVGVGRGPSGFNLQLWDEDGFVPGTHVTSPDGPVRCTDTTGIAVGDFVAGDGPDVVIYSLPAELEAVEPVDGARCVFANQGDGTFVQVSAAPLNAFGQELGGFAGVADLDGDGHLDAYFALLGTIAFGDGLGGFTEVRVPDACWRPNAGVIDFFGNAPAIFDVDRDGRLDLISPPKKTIDFAMGAAQTLVNACVLRNEGGRAFSAQPAPALDHPDFDECFTVACTQFSPADVDSDGYTDLFMYHLSTGFRVALGGPAGFTPTALRETNDGVGFTPGDFDGDGRIDLAVGSRDEADYVLINQIEAAGSRIILDLRDASGAPGGRGATIRVDLDGDGDFDTGPQAGAVGVAGRVQIGIGATDAVDVRISFADRGAPGGNVVEQRVDMGSTTVVADPQ